MKPEKLRQLTPEELEARVRDLRNQVFNLRIKHSTGQLENAAGLRVTRRDLARVLTVQNERSRAE
ncbi:MAG: 50S ribosomal protein L29 [Myxococcales bacterium]|nr:50S ribosomal protein L29 [Myxococcales bacterium]MCZ6713816.1 50S ribosomal protein L29 [Deltaproteobacteria bacterium]MCZ6823741.1 50S ribosomal protein L29 [Deltaproteobacteria bacterium]TDJ02643.1 MAG: 50S ribosomal protein L29 [Deltaproteobacteria bacterium]TDJ07012.1 MAG: 50S ribosomal protein L29 [Deltaproteobacteria bacterium]